MKKVSNRQGVVKRASKPVSKVEEVLPSSADSDMRFALIQALPGVQARERPLLSGQVRTDPYTAQVAKRLWSGHLRSGAVGHKGDQRRMCRREPLGREQPGRRPRGIPHLAPPRHGALPETELQNHQLHRSGVWIISAGLGT